MCVYVHVSSHSGSVCLHHVASALVPEDHVDGVIVHSKGLRVDGLIGEVHLETHQGHLLFFLSRVVRGHQAFE